MGRFSTPFQHALRGGGRVPRPAHGQWTGAGLRWRLLESIAGVKDDMQSVLRWLEGKLPRIIYWGIENIRNKIQFRTGETESGTTPIYYEFA